MSLDRTHNLRASAIYLLPFTANAFVSGWQVSGIVSAVSGAPFTPLIGFDQAGLQTGGTQRPNLVSGRSLDDAVTGGSLDTVCGCIVNYFDPTFFTLPRPARSAPASGAIRCAARPPHRRPGVSKNVGLGGTIPAAPRRSVQPVQPGQLRPAQPGGLHRHGGRRRRVQPECRSDHVGGSPRQMQLAVKLVF